MSIPTEPYLEQHSRLPQSGYHIVGQYDDEAMVFYVPRFGAFYSNVTISRPVWIKPSFMWYMTQSEWLQGDDQQQFEGVRIQHAVVHDLLSMAVHMQYVPELYRDELTWEKEHAAARVWVQWDKEFAPNGVELDRHNIQIAIHSREWMQRLMNNEIVPLEDLSDFVAQQQPHAQPPYTNLSVPREDVYPIDDSQLAQHVGISR